MATVRLLVLGVLHLKQEAHGYAIVQTLRDWNAEAWADIKIGSIYHALKQLQHEDKLSCLGTTTSQEGPSKTLYRLTPAGEALFFELLERALTSIKLEDFSAGIPFLQALSPHTLQKLLTQQHHTLQNFQAALQHLTPPVESPSQPPHTATVISLWQAQLTAMRTWNETFRQEIAQGKFLDLNRFSTK